MNHRICTHAEPCAFSEHHPNYLRCTLDFDLEQSLTAALVFALRNWSYHHPEWDDLTLGQKTRCFMEACRVIRDEKLQQEVV